MFCRTTALVLIDRHGRRLWGVSAVRSVSRRIPLLWPFAPLLHFPGSLPLWQAIYRFIANRRYALGRRRLRHGRLRGQGAVRAGSRDRIALSSRAESRLRGGFEGREFFPGGLDPPEFGRCIFRMVQI